MASNTVGTLRIVLDADLAKWVSGFNRATTQAERFVSRVGKDLDKLERNLQKAGTSVSLKLGAPLAALAVAAVRVADPTNRLGDEIERLGLQAQQALAPLGQALIRLWDDAKPYLEDGVRLITAVSQTFAELEPETQRMIVAIGAGVVAAGPALLAMSAAVTIGKQLVGVVGLLFGTITKRLTLVTAVATAFAGIGKALYESSADVQRFGAYLVFAIEETWATIKFGWRGLMIDLEAPWESFLQFVANSANTKLVIPLQAAFAAAAKYGIGGFKNIGIAGTAALSGISAELTKAGQAPPGKVAAYIDNLNLYQEERSQIDAVLANDLAQIDRDFAEGGASAGSKFWEELQKSFSGLAGDAGGLLLETGNPLGDALDPAVDALRKLQSKIDELRGKPLPAVITRKDAEEIRRVTAELNALQKEAERIRLEVYPQEKLAQDLARLEELREKFPTIITADVFDRYSAQLKAALDKATGVASEGAKEIRSELEIELTSGVQNFSRSVSGAFADMAVEGKASLKDLGNEFLKLIVEIVSRKAVFEKVGESLAGPIGSFFGGLFGGKPGSVPSATTAEGNRFGNAFRGGSVIPFAAGGVVTSPTYFPMTNGLGLMGEAGPEAIMPLNRDASGRLGVRAAGGGVTVNVIDQRASGQRPQVSTSKGPDGTTTISILVRDEVNRGLADGSFDRSLGGFYGLKRRGQSR